MNAKKQIFFLHFAGGSAYSYDFLKPHLEGYDIHQMELPGRGRRVAEPFVANMQMAIDDYLQQIKSKLSGLPFLIFGHSMGAVIAAYLTNELEKQNIYPVKLLVSGNPGPGAIEYKKRYLLPRKEFLEELKNMGGMPDGFFGHDGLIDYFVPILKSDFKVLEAEDDRQFDPFRTSIVAIMGDEEEKVHMIDNWKKHTQSSCTTHILKGKHFFIHNHAEQIARLIRQGFQNGSH